MAVVDELPPHEDSKINNTQVSAARNVPI